VNAAGRGITDNLLGTSTRANFSPTDAGQYNRVLNQVDAGSMVTGAMMTTTGGTSAVAAAAVVLAGETGGASLVAGGAAVGEAVVGGILMMNGAKNLTEGNHYGEAKSVPNPDGSKGGPEHQGKVNEVEKDMQSRGLETEREVKVETPNGEKNYRKVDVVGTNPETGAKEQVNVGKQNKNGTPVARERRAQKDIQNATNNDVKFIPYK